MYRYSFAFLLLLILGSCSKKSDNPGEPGDGEYYLRYKSDGVQKEYKAITLAQFYYDAENLTYHCNMTSSLALNNASKDMLSLLLVNKESYKTGVTYQLTNGIEMAKNGAIMPQAAIALSDENGKPYTAQFLPATWYQFDDMAEVRFTAITDKFVKGTFSGLAFTAMPERAEKKVTDGEFYLRIH